MRKVFSSLLIFIFAFFVFSISPVSAKVITDQAGSVSIGKTEVVNDDLFIGAQAVEIAGTVNGDVFIGAQNVKITGIINGNLHIGANTLDLGGTVKGNVYIGAQSVLVSASSIGGSLLTGAATVDVDKDSVIGGSILAGAGMLTIDSQVKRSVYAGTGSLTIGGDAKIGKDFYYAADNSRGRVNISADAKIAGNIYKSEINAPQKSTDLKAVKPAAMNAARMFAGFISFLGALIIGFIYFKLSGKHLTQTADIVTASFWKSLGIGFLVSISFIPGLIVLFITVIGIPVAGLALLMLMLYSYLAKIIVGSAIGAYLSQKFNWRISAYGAFAFGLLTIYIVKSVPVIGFAAGLIVLWSGLGALTLQMFSKSD